MSGQVKTGVTSSHFSFFHILCHELGHFYSIYTECPGAGLFRYMDQNPRTGIEAQKQIGYWVWTEFVAEAIACHIHPDVDIDWDDYRWYSIRYGIAQLIGRAFYRYSDSIDEYALGQYYAEILANKTAVAFQQAAADGRVRYRRHFRAQPMTFREAGIDPKCRSEVDERYHLYLDELERLLSKQLQKEPFWRIEPDFLLEISKQVLCMALGKRLMSDHQS